VTAIVESQNHGGTRLK